MVTKEVKELEMQKRMSGYIKDYLTDPTKATELIPSNTGIDMNIESQIAAYNLNKLKRDKLIEGSSDKNPVVQELNKSLNAMRQNIIRAVRELYPEIVEVECMVAKLAPPLGGKVGRVSVTLKG